MRGCLMNVKPFILLLLFSVFLIGTVYAPPNIVSGDNFAVMMNNTSSLGFQSVPDSYVLLTVSSGLLNSTTNTLRITRDSGLFRFTALNNTTLDITFTVSQVQVDQTKINSGDSVVITAGQTRVIRWIILLEPILPVMFILGMVGLCSMVGGGFYSAHKIKKGEYYEGGRMGLIYIAVGFGLFIAWVFMGV